MPITGNFETRDDAAAATVKAFTITWTTKNPTASTALTIADGSSPASAEIGIALKSMNAQITALIADVLAIRTAIND